METLEAGQAYLALPESGHGAGVLMLHAWWGLNDFFKATVDRLAAEGFVVLAPDLYDGVVVTTIEDAEAASNALDFEHAAALIDQAVDFLAAHPAVAAARADGSALGVVGFSMGAGFAFWLANQQPDVIAAVVAFYGTYGDGDLSQMRAAFQGHYAETDPFESREEVEKLDQMLTGMGLEANFFVYEGTGHWFFEADRDAYHAESARLSWEWMLKFLREKLKTSG